MKLRLIKRRLIVIARSLIKIGESVVPPVFKINWRIIDIRLWRKYKLTFTIEERMEEFRKFQNEIIRINNMRKEKFTYEKAIKCRDSIDAEVDFR